MRLLNIHTRKLEEFVDESIPKYAILSHTWGADEVLYSHIQENGYKGGSVKVDGCCAQAAKDGLHYVWIDTCCIDKSSSAELSEAINSMFAWYRDSVVCYAYLADVPDEEELDGGVPDDGGSGDSDGDGSDRVGDGSSDDDGSDDDGPDDDGYSSPRINTNSAFAKSRWFTRGWTLQELLAPDNVVFFTASWSPLGRKPSRSTTTRTLNPDPLAKINTRIRALSRITGIPTRYMSVGGLEHASVAQEMSWAAGRKTTRKEDRAYSLWGIFGVNMPMLYGEGDNAFVRLQEEILRLSDDQSLLAWGFGLPPPGNWSGLLAKSPDDFAKCGNVQSFRGREPHYTDQHYTMTNKGLRITLQASGLLQDYSSFLAYLKCGIRRRGGLRDLEERIVLPLWANRMDNCYYREPNGRPQLHPFRKMAGFMPDFDFERRALYIARDLRWYPWPRSLNNRSLTVLSHGFDLASGIKECYPEAWTRALRPGQLIQGFHDDPIRETALFLHTGGGLPDFIAKVSITSDVLLRPPLCVAAWMLIADAPMSLAGLICQELRSLKERNVWRFWLDALDDVVQWKTDLIADDGTCLSARLEETPTGMTVIRFEKGKAELDAEASMGDPSSSSGVNILLWARREFQPPVKLE